MGPTSFMNGTLLDLLHLVETLDEDQIGDLLDNLKRIGEAD